MSLLVFLLWLAAVAGVITWAVVAQPINPPRLNLEAWAKHNGWTYTWDGHSWLPFLAKHLGTKLGAEALAVIEGTWDDHKFTVFEHWFFDPDHPTVKITFTVAVAPLERPIPALQLLPRAKAALREIPGEEVLTGHDAFDGQYRLRAADGDVAVRVLGETLIDDLAAGADLPFLVTGDHVVTWSRGAMVPEQAENLIAGATWLAGTLTDVWEPSPEIA